MAGITYRDQELEESFSFSSCYDFNSSSFQSIFSDESEDESYIEIALEPSNIQQKNYDGDIDNWADEEMELRISFSSSVPFQEPSTTASSIEYESAATMSKSPSSSSSKTTFTMNSSSPSKESGQWDTQMGSEASNSTCRIQKANKRKIQFPKVHSFLIMLNPILTVSSEANGENGHPANTNQLELVRTRTKGSKETATTSSGIMTRFLVKFQTLKIRTLLASVMKSCQETTFPREKKNIGTYQRLMKQFDKWLVRKGQGSSSSNSNKPFGNGERSGVMEKNVDAMSTCVGGKDGKSTSCLTSTKSSPTHQGFSSGDQDHKICAKDSSIQAAIAHYNTQLGLLRAQASWVLKGAKDADSVFTRSAASKLKGRRCWLADD
ncbi:hypothetical protein SADUNF_Sadunf04G0166100 [Salix dunnii]|uniref:Uncharacterized protein n=1 Tax=Salix dunnii TaxID=1413687 RepID=A0A835K8X1_9ROSI|nr:hypothetical protein SADUNF_Sadunf04G0166100 [Salix dunnii]